MTEKITIITQSQQSTQIDNPMECEEEPQETKLKTDKIRLEMNAEFEGWKTTVQEERTARTTSAQ